MSSKKSEIKISLKLFRSKVKVCLLCLAILIAIPLQLLDFMLTGKNRIFKIVENKIFKTLFYINDLKTHKK